jgi:asparagine synthase (glutamine-hydrolysing)
MTAFAGIVTFGGMPTDGRTEQAVLVAAAGPRGARAAAFRTANGIIAQRLEDVARRRAPPPEGAPVFAADARLDNRNELAAHLGVAAPAGAADDADLIRHACDRFGDIGIARCVGAFAFALWRPGERRLLLGRDCLGRRALFYYRGDGFVAFASTLGGLLALPRVPRVLDEIALAHFLAVNLTPSRETFYRGIMRVPSRCVVELGPETENVRAYWSPAFDGPTYRRDEDYIERARELFDQAVGDATADLPRLAIACSGGLDSSAVAATVARLRHDRPIACYSVVPPPGTRIEVGPRRYLDESDKLAALARLYPALDMHLMAPETLHPYESDPARIFARAHMPVLGPTTLAGHGALYDAVSAAQHPALLVGSAGNIGLSWDGSFSLLTLLRQGRIGALASDLSAIARREGRGLMRTLFAEIVLPGAPAWARRALHEYRGRPLNDVGRYSALNPAFVADNGLPRQWREQGFDAWPLPAGWDERGFRAMRMFDTNQVGREFRASSRDLFGFEIRDPHADRRLLEFALNVPERLYRSGGVPRSFARAVFADRLPPEILSERRRGMVAATWFRRLDARRDDIAQEIERLEASPAARRLIDIERLKGLLRDWPVDDNAAQARRHVYRGAFTRALHVGRFIRWVESANA